MGNDEDDKDTIDVREKLLHTLRYLMFLFDRNPPNLNRCAFTFLLQCNIHGVKA